MTTRGLRVSSATHMRAGYAGIAPRDRAYSSWLYSSPAAASVLASKTWLDGGGRIGGM